MDICILTDFHMSDLSSNTSPFIGVFRPLTIIVIDISRYTTSMEILEDLFPKDKAIFLMCDSGNKSRSVIKLLAQYGWDMSRIYNVGNIAAYKTETYSKYFLTSTDSQKKN